MKGTVPSGVATVAYDAEAVLHYQLTVAQGNALVAVHARAAPLDDPEFREKSHLVGGVKRLHLRPTSWAQRECYRNNFKKGGLLQLNTLRNAFEHTFPRCGGTGKALPHAGSSSRKRIRLEKSA